MKKFFSKIGIRLSLRSLFFVVMILVAPSVTLADFNRDLYFGMRNDPEVARLQEFLRDKGFYSYPEITGNFFQVTRLAVVKFQIAQGIVPAAGYFGTITRGAVNRTFKSAPAAGGSASAKDKIKITSVARSGSDPKFESITIENKSASVTISITGFAVVSSKATFTIPKGHYLPGFSATADDLILLKPRERAVIAAGRQSKMMDFRGNLCVGYFSEASAFSPPLPFSCPRPGTLKLHDLSDQCGQLIDSTQECRAPDFRKIFDSPCSEFINQHFNYAGCVRDYRSEANFFSDQWFVWMQRDEEFFKDRHDEILLKDQQGNIVDAYEY